MFASGRLEPQSLNQKLLVLEPEIVNGVNLHTRDQFAHQAHMIRAVGHQEELVLRMEFNEPSACRFRGKVLSPSLIKTKMASIKFSLS